MSSHTPVKQNFNAVKRHPFYFGSKEKPLLGWLHTTDSKQYSSTGIIICPPLAVEYMNSYRALRYIADYFALAGIPAIRFDYHGTGDSSGIEENNNRVEDWLWSIHQATAQLKILTGCSKFGLLGFRMGATLAALAAKTTATEFLILWAALDNGKNYIREIKLIQMTGQNQSAEQTLLEAGGMGYWPQTVENMRKISLPAITPKAKHILVIPRDEQISDTTLYDAWKKKNLDIELQTYLGSTEMLIDAHQTVIPHQTIKNIIQWAQQNTSQDSVPNITQTTLPKAQTSVELNDTSINSRETAAQNTILKESLVYFGENKSRFGILTELKQPAKSSLPTIIIANSGANHRVGPSRIYVLIARELALLGFRCLRIDVPGIGDSIISNTELENDEYIHSSSTEILDAIKSLGDDYKDKEYILMGLCSGSYFSFHAALKLTEIKIKESILINPLTFYWDKGMSVHNSPTQDFSVWSWYKKAFSSRQSWLKLLKGQIDFKSLISAIKNRMKTKLGHIKLNTTIKDANRHRQKLASDLTKITDNGIHIQFMLARRDPGYDILMTHAGRAVKKLRKKNKLGFTFIENADHTFSRYQPRCTLISELIQHLKRTIE